MGKATVTITHGKSQSFDLIEGSNIKLAPTFGGKGIEINVEPSETWINPGKATKEKDGLLPQLPDNENKCLNGKGQWVDMPKGEGDNTPTTYETFSTGKDGLVPGPTTNIELTDSWLRADGQWAKIPEPKETTYTYKNVPYIIIDNIDCLSGSTFEDQSLKLRVYKDKDNNKARNENGTTTSTMVVNEETYYCARKENIGYKYGRTVASIWVSKEWADNLLNKKFNDTNKTAVLEIIAGQMKGVDGRYACTFYTLENTQSTPGRTYEPYYINKDIIEQFPTPTLEVSVLNAGSYPDVSEAGQICGWISRTNGTFTNTAKTSYSALPFAMKLDNRITYQSYPWLLFGTYMGNSGHDRSCTLSFCAIKAKEDKQ